MQVYRPTVAEYPQVTRLYRQWGEKAKCGKRDQVYCWKGEAITAAARILEPEPGVYLLRNLTVDPQHRRQGLARALMRAVLSERQPLYCYCQPYLGEFYHSLGMRQTPPEEVPETIAGPFRQYQKRGKGFILMAY
ncbi:GNAT family N-acetyltransferase [Gilvimarinus sp. DA14]|uniref:GNAT family N-acetyltransferase n=1 Tax=Gilvimarinus sp. DA14 TaxID=2956798 RepID=UPI0020B690CE|nr:GNAT family N-acetyltransferase [Gilvimarinus sp. DA14]UTF61176.1 GNAT family N-acetyltransferase [Gilvimarinus sp. DA14]